MENRIIHTTTFSDANAKFRVAEGDLLKQPVDAIVNAANGWLKHNGGVALAIARAAGPALNDASQRLVQSTGQIPVGDAAATTAGDLPFRGVIHAVGPRQGDGNEQKKLTSALLSSFRIANIEGWKSLAFPAVSSGIFGVPGDVCAKAYWSAVRTFFSTGQPCNLREISLVLLPNTMSEIVMREINQSTGTYSVLTAWRNWWKRVFNTRAAS